MRDAMSKIHLEILDETRKAAWKKLSPFVRQGYLAGGTALALQINHRKSVDFDIFINKAVDNRLHRKVEKIFGKNDYYVNTGDQISFTTRDGIGITFVWCYYKLLYPVVHTSSLPLASVYDIAADKAHTIGRRAVWRDYVDFFILLKWKIVTIATIIELAQKKFGGEFSETQFLQQLSYFDDLRQMPIEFLKDSYTTGEIKAFLEREVANYLKKILPV